jgi:TRAP-type C4-dicarboxylate transport system permease small subunit
MYAGLYRLADIIARTLALLGGLVLLAIIILTTVSIIGRALVPLDIGLGPIRGIYDMTEIGMAAAVFAFLPWCQLKQSHAVVDLFLPVIPNKMNQLLELVFNAGMLFIAAIGTWRMYLGLLDKHSYGETTLIAQIPVWQGYAVSMVGAVGFVIVSAFCVLRSVRVLIGLNTEEAARV